MEYDFDYYSGIDLKYPVRLRKPRLPVTETAEAHRAYADELEQYEKYNAQRKQDLIDYKKASSDRMTEFMNKLRDDYDLSQGQFDVLWNHAWEHGHSAGLHEVYHYFDEFYDMATEFARLEK